VARTGETRNVCRNLVEKLLRRWHIERLKRRIYFFGTGDVETFGSHYDQSSLATFPKVNIGSDSK
jgi:hypothetical protein